jgi:hypothetical protein
LELNVLHQVLVVVVVDDDDDDVNLGEINIIKNPEILSTGW